MGKEVIKNGKFIAVHPVGNEVTMEATTSVGEAVKANHTVDAYWVRARYAREEGKIYCEYDAKDAESVRRVLAKAVPDFPLEGVYKIEWEVYSEDFR